MPSLSATEPFPYLPMRGASNLRRSVRPSFDQVVSSGEPRLDSVFSSYMLDSLSESVSQQSLSQEQIVKSQITQRKERISIALKAFSLRNLDDIKQFLERNSYLIPLIEEIPSKISEYFETEELYLEIIADPDFPQSSELWISVLTNKSALHSRPIMDQFDNDWWFENLDRAQCKLNITLEYV
ncbi:MAG: hypothetical protein ACRD6X_05480 [Pyrinomonadaceae bacterium]